MDHIEHYFLNTGKVLQKNIQEKSIVIDVVHSITKVLLDKKELTIKKNIIFLHVFGAKRSRILSCEKQILEILASKHGLIILGVQ